MEESLFMNPVRSSTNLDSHNARAHYVRRGCYFKGEGHVILRGLVVFLVALRIEEHKSTQQKKVALIKRSKDTKINGHLILNERKILRLQIH